MQSDVFDILMQMGDEFTFRERPISIPYDMRSDYRIAILLLMLHYCGWKKQAPLAKLHVLNWSHRSDLARRAFLDRLDGKLHMKDVPIKFDPAFNRAIDMARGEFLIERTTNHALAITPTGNAWLEELLADPTCLPAEKSFFQAVGKRFTNTMLQSILNPSSIW